MQPSLASGGHETGAAPERVVVLDGPVLAGTDAVSWSELLLAGSEIDRQLLLDRDSTLDPTDCVAIELRPGEPAGRALTHRDYLAAAGTAPPARS